MYPELRTSVSADEREHLVLQHWKTHDIFRRSIGERSGAPVFSFYEGPPTVNGMPGIHHVWSRTIKDTICRYKTMRGFRVERKGGWDTHGLPVELAIEKQLGFRHKHEIEEYGIAKFNELCRESVYENIAREGGWQALTERMAYWVDMEHPYITCTPDYVESIWWALKKFWDGGKIYKGYKIQPYCPRCETALSSHEVALGYDTAKDPSVFVKFRRKNVAEEEFFLAWTTTPWTLLANVALAVHPDVEYVTVINKRKDKSERLVLAEALIGKLEGETEIVARTMGKDLEGAEYEPLFDYKLPYEYQTSESADGLVLPDGTRVMRPHHIVVADKYVTTEDGTGIVHQAPAFGDDDYRIARAKNFPIVISVNGSGEIVLDSPYKGVFFKDADPKIIEELKNRGMLYRKETIEHTYPFCWRCDTALMYYARESWYIRVTDYREELSTKNKTINWQPPEIGEGRFGNWLAELKDWGISRERYWGTPLPIWESVDGEIRLCVGKYEDFLEKHTLQAEIRNPAWLEWHLERMAGTATGAEPTERIPVRLELEAYLEDPDPTKVHPTRVKSEDLKNFDPHKPGIDGIIFLGRLPDSSLVTLRRVPDVIDVWFDSGSMPFAQYHYPFENKELFEKAYPADFISEGIDQTRGWFYTLHAINTFLFGKPAYKNVIVNDMLLDKNGQKMSKSRGNVVDPFEVIRTYGVDAVRWYLLASSVPWKPKLFDAADVADIERKFFGTLLNTYGFFALYANIDSYASQSTASANTRNEMDRWILSKLNSLVKDCASYMDSYELTKPARAIQEFVIEELSNWYIRRSRRRFWKGEMNADKQAAYDTLRECLVTVAKLMAPIAPFMSDTLYRSLSGGDSVHLELYPTPNDALIDSKLETRMAKAQTISSLVRQMRERAKLKVRQPLERVLIPCANRYDIEELRKVEDIVLDEVNVKHVEYVLFGDSDVIQRKAKANFKALGARLGKQMKSVAARIGTMTDEEITRYEQQMFIEFDIDGEKVRVERGEIDVTAQDVQGWLVSSEGGVTVALDTHLTAELLSEGLAREFVNRIQNLRKDSGFEVTDRITIAVGGAPAELADALAKHKDYISQETLAATISNDGASDGTDIDLGELTAKVSIARV
ncbi:MAG: isoleucine--tRNA ligase [Bacteroidetes bacterium]|nr:isoleucine--tRNA ligase [Bacteroidota bacterium]